MKKTNTYQSVKISKNSYEKVDDTLVVEAPLQININNEAYTVVMRTPGDDEELTRGLLYAEDICKKKEDLQVEIISENEDFSTVINVKISSVVCLFLS